MTQIDRKMLYINRDTLPVRWLRVFHGRLTGDGTPEARRMTYVLIVSCKHFRANKP